MSKARIAVCVFWLAFLTALGPALISHASYELPILGGLLALGGAYATYRVFFKRASDDA